MLTLLLATGADVTAKDQDGKTAVDLAREFKQEEAEKILEKAGAPATEPQAAAEQGGR